MSNVAELRDSNDWFAAYSAGGAGTFVSARPLAYFLVVHDVNTNVIASTVGYVWDTVANSFLPAINIVGFAGYFRVRNTEPVALCSESDFARAIDPSSNVSDKDRRGLIDTEVAIIMARLIAYSKVNGIVLPKLIRGEGV